jgi:hypothetical protein
MGSDVSSVERRANLPVILIAAVVQGWALYALHMSLTHKHWPATEPGWLLALYAIAALIPLTVQMLSQSVRDKTMWAIVGGIAVLFFYFGWHHGSRVAQFDEGRYDFVEQWFTLGFVLAILWLMMLPFIQARIACGRWRAPYVALFANAWNNKLVLLEAALFTGVFWLLLMLMQQLFFMLGISFFRDLFDEPIFIYPVTSITFGIALHLIGSLERLTKLVLDQILNVLKWLALLAIVILTLFTLALVFKLPGMIESGQRAIGAAWLLWLIAVTVLLVNAAYRDGTNEQPYPRAIAIALRFAIPLTVVIALTALYALYLRIERYGFTVERVWACVVAAAACVYSVGYAIAARGARPWMAGIARVNVIAALFLMAVLALALTPLLSPFRISAASQFAQVIEGTRPRTGPPFNDPLQYLRMRTGEYGIERLQSLAKIDGIEDAEGIRRDAKHALETKPGAPFRRSPRMLEEALNALVPYPADRALEPALRTALEAHLSKPEFDWVVQGRNGTPVGVFIDMDGNQTDEFVLVLQSIGLLFEKRGEEWFFATRLMTPYLYTIDWQREIAKTEVRTRDPKWKELVIGEHTFRRMQTSTDGRD